MQEAVAIYFEENNMHSVPISNMQTNLPSLPSLVLSLQMKCCFGTGSAELRQATAGKSCHLHHRTPGGAAIRHTAANEYVHCTLHRLRQ